MSIEYHLIQKVDPNNRTAPKKYYASLKAYKTITARDLANSISAGSSLTPVDVMAMIEALVQIIPKELAEGNVVQLGEFGSFFLNLNSESVEDPHDFTADKIKKAVVRFRPGKVIKERLKSLDFRKKRKSE